MSYCGNCGAQIHEGQSFCAGCGTTVSESEVPPQQPREASTDSAAAQQSREATLRKLATLKAQVPPPKNSGKKILIAVLAMFLVGAIAAVAGVVYVGYRVKQKATAALHNLQGKSGEHKTTGEGGSGDGKSNPGNNGDGSSGRDADNPLSAVLGKLQGSAGGSTTPMGNMAKSIFEDLGAKNPEMPGDLLRNMPYSTLTNPPACLAGEQIDPAKLAAGKIRFSPGTVLTHSWSLPLADAESDSIIRSSSPPSLIFEYNGIVAEGLDMSIKGHADLNNTVCAKDIAEGDAYSTGWSFKSVKDPLAPGLYPGVSRLLVPAHKFSQLKSSGSTTLVFAWYDYMDALTEWELIAWKGTLTRVEPDDVQFPLIINDERVNVAAIHVRANMKVIESGGRFGLA